jgi:hypothetical protein
MLSGCPDPRIGTNPPLVPVAQEAYFNVRTGYELGNLHGDYATRDIIARQETDRDCLPTVLRMWLKYLRDVAYREGWLASQDPDQHFDSITDRLSSYLSTARLGHIWHEYETTGYSYGASGPWDGREQPGLGEVGLRAKRRPR